MITQIGNSKESIVKLLKLIVKILKIFNFANPENNDSFKTIP